MSQHGSMTPEEVEVGRRNLIAELRAEVERGRDVAALGAETLRELIAVLEAPVVTRSVEIPEAGETAAFEALRAHEDASYWNSCACHCGATFETTELLHKHIANSVVAAALPYLAPAGDGGLREALDDLRAWCEMQREAAGLEESEFAAGEFLAFKRVIVHLRKLLTDHPTAPAVPQPVDREALLRLFEEKDVYTRSSPPLADRWRGALADAVLAVLADEQVERGEKS